MRHLIPSLFRPSRFTDDKTPIPPADSNKDCASASFNLDFYCIETYAHHRSRFRDPEASQHLLPPDATDEVLGAAVLDALAHSRFIPLEELHKLPMTN